MEYSGEGYSYISALLLSGAKGALIQRCCSNIPGSSKLWNTGIDRAVGGRIVQENFLDILLGK